MDKYESLEKNLCEELEIIEQKLRGGQEMSETDLKRADLITHTMKSLATYKAMKEAEEYEGEMDGYSGRRGRAMNGRYVSRDGGASYSEGYSHGYSEAMDQMSGRWPMPRGFRY